jgi:fibro-slime domain-containing protein
MRPESRHNQREALGAFLVVTGMAMACDLDARVHAGSPSTPPPDSITLVGVVRDFREWNVDGGHSDFDLDGRGAAWCGCNTGVWSDIVADTLGVDSKPEYSGDAFLVSTDWKDSSGRPIYHGLSSAAAGDSAGVKGCSGSGGVASAASFDQWFTDVPGVNMSEALELTLVRQSDGSYVFDDTTDPAYSSLGGFFPIDGRLFGNSPVKKGVDHNYHFTVELHTQFTYDADAAPMFKFVGDDDVFVFIDGKKVIDLGGIHAAREQHVDLSRLGLTDGETYNLDFFFAERNRVASNFRIVTNLQLKATKLPSVSASYD